MNSLRIRQRAVVPPQGWRFFVPEKSYWSRTEHNSLKSCVREYLQFCKDNGVKPIEDPDRYIEQTLCEQLGPDWCEGFDPTAKKSASFVVHFEEFKQGMTTLGHNLARAVAEGKRINVEADEINRRASICVRCSHNGDLVGCGSCAKRSIRAVVNRVAEFIVGCPPTPFDKQLRNCDICTCDLKAKICIPIDITRQHMSAEQMARLPEFCWIK